jgi:hypothetical protein
MVATKDVLTVDHFLQIVTKTMFYASRYEKEWPKNCIAMLELLGDELKKFVKPLGRDLAEALKLNMTPGIRGIVITEWEYLVPKQPAYIVCYSDLDWFLVKLPEQTRVYAGEALELLPELLGRGVGGMMLFLDVCAYAISELFRERRKKLDELEATCLFEKMYESFEPSKWADNLKYIKVLASLI